MQRRALKMIFRSLQTMLGGKRQVVLITGEAGIGKTALLNGFLDQVSAAHPIMVTYGQCVEQYGTREAYLPIFDALRTLRRGIHASEVIGALTRHAPSWLAQMAGVLSNDQFQMLQQTIHGTTQSRMLRELGEVLEALAVERPVILALEDLQWSDHSTLDILSIIARRRESARPDDNRQLPAGGRYRFRPSAQECCPGLAGAPAVQRIVA